MAKVKKVNPKKEIQAYIVETLEKTFDKVKDGMAEKKFKRNIKKAGKMIMADFKIVKQKAAKEVKKTTKKVKKPAKDVKTEVEA